MGYKGFANYYDTIHYSTHTSCYDTIRYSIHTNYYRGSIHKGYNSNPNYKNTKNMVMNTYDNTTFYLVSTSNSCNMLQTKKLEHNLLR